MRRHDGTPAFKMEECRFSAGDVVRYRDKLFRVRWYVYPGEICISPLEDGWDSIWFSFAGTYGSTNEHFPAEESACQIIGRRVAPTLFLPGMNLLFIAPRSSANPRPVTVVTETESNSISSLISAEVSFDGRSPHPIDVRHLYAPANDFVAQMGEDVRMRFCRCQGGRPMNHYGRIIEIDSSGKVKVDFLTLKESAAGGGKFTWNFAVGELTTENREGALLKNDELVMVEEKSSGYL